MTDRPDSDEITVVDKAVRMRIAIGNTKVNSDIDEKGDLAGNVEEEEILGETPEESEFQWRKEGRVHSPYQNKMRPKNVSPALNVNPIFFSVLFRFRFCSESRRSDGLLQCIIVHGFHQPLIFVIKNPPTVSFYYLNK